MYNTSTAHTALAWAAFFACVHRSACWWLRSGTRNAARPSDEKRRACEYAVPSMIHATVSLGWGVYVLYIDDTGGECPFAAHGSMHAYTDASRALSCFALGYFVWDLAESVRHNMEWPWKVHALMGMLVFAVSAGVLAPPLMAWYATYWLLNEASTPFFNLRTLMISYGGATRFPLAFLVVQLLFVTTFILVRVVWGAPRTYEVVTRTMSAAMGVGADADVARGKYDRIVFVYVGVSAVAMYALNCFWALGICRAIMRGKKEEPEKEP